MTTDNLGKAFAIYDSVKNEIFRNPDPWSKVLWIWPTRQDAEEAISRVIDVYRAERQENVKRFAILQIDIFLSRGEVNEDVFLGFARP